MQEILNVWKRGFDTNHVVQRRGLCSLNRNPSNAAASLNGTTSLGEILAGNEEEKTETYGAKECGNL